MAEPEENDAKGRQQLTHDLGHMAWDRGGHPAIPVDRTRMLYPANAIMLASRTRTTRANGDVLAANDVAVERGTPTELERGGGRYGAMQELVT